MSKPDDYQKGIPGVPLSALNAIQDQNTRQVLRAIVDGWHVRNGASGTGDNRFVTAGELKSVSANAASALATVNQWQSGPPGGGRVLSSGEINRVITDLEASVMESLLWKELGTTINRIKVDTSKNAASIHNEVTQRINADNAIVQQTNTQFTVINGNVGLLQQQYTTMSNNVAALAQSLTTLQADVGQNSVALQQEMTVRANADNDLYAKYSVKIDNNGYVSGFGLMSTSNNSVPFSEFIVRADRFAIGSPSGPGITPAVPFIVTTTPDSKGNPPGVYMRNAMIANAAIGTAQIDDLAVNTLKIAGGSVTSMTYQEGVGGSLPANGGEYVAQVYLDMPVGASGVVATGTVLLSGASGNATVWLMIGKTPVGDVLGGPTSTLIKLTGVSVVSGFFSSFSITAFDPNPTGYYSYWLAVKNPDSGPGSYAAFNYNAPSITVVGGKR